MTVGMTTFQTDSSSITHLLSVQYNHVVVLGNYHVLSSSSSYTHVNVNYRHLQTNNLILGRNLLLAHDIDMNYEVS